MVAGENDFKTVFKGNNIREMRNSASRLRDIILALVRFISSSKMGKNHLRNIVIWVYLGYCIVNKI